MRFLLIVALFCSFFSKDSLSLEGQPKKISRNEVKDHFYNTVLKQEVALSGSEGRVSKWSVPIVMRLFGSQNLDKFDDFEDQIILKLIHEIGSIVDVSIDYQSDWKNNDPAGLNFLIISERRSKFDDLLKRLVAKGVLPGNEFDILKYYKRWRAQNHKHGFCSVTSFSEGVGGQLILSVVVIEIIGGQDYLKGCFVEEVVQGFGLLGDLGDGVHSLLSDDNIYSYITPLDKCILEILYNSKILNGMNSSDLDIVFSEYRQNGLFDGNYCSKIIH